MFEDIKHKKVLVTGASAGIGFEIAKSFSKNKCLVAINSRNKNKLDLCYLKHLDNLTIL